MEEAVDRLADELIPMGRAREPDGGGVGQEDPIAVVDEDGIRRKLHQLQIARLALGTEGVPRLLVPPPLAFPNHPLALGQSDALTDCLDAPRPGNGFLRD